MISPKALTVNLDGIPKSMQDAPRWLMWKFVQVKGKWAKVPFQVTGEPASSSNPATWTTFDDVADAYVMDGRWSGIGFALGDDYFGIDSDDSRDPDTGVISAFAQGVLDRVDGYAEVSPSGTGFKIFTKSALNFSKNDSHGNGLEAYSKGRYFTVTGHQLNGHAGLPAELINLDWVPSLFGDPVKTPVVIEGEWRLEKGPLEGWSDPAKIRDELLAHIDPSCDYTTWIMVGQALHHQFEGGEEGLQLWDEWSSDGDTYSPDQQEYKYSTFSSHRDGGGVTLASVIQLAKPARALAVVAASRDELAESLSAIRSAMDVITIKTVIAPMLKNAGLDALDHEQAVSAVAVRLRELTGVRPQIKDVRDMCVPARARGANDAPEWATEYVWITSEDTFLHTTTQERLSKMSFNATHNRTIQPQFGEDAMASDIALDTFQIDVVHKQMYLPYGADRFTLDGVSYANSYRPSTVPMTATVRNSVVEAAFEAHIMSMCDGDYAAAKILTQWLAHQVQNPGKKVRWAPLIKGIEGDGKSLLGGLLQSTMGLVNVSTISPKVLKTDFNGWAEGRCVGVLEEIRLAGHSRYDIANAIKPNIANDQIPIHRKGVDEYNIINTMNYLAFTNFTDALPLDDTDRRWYILFSPFTSPSELPNADYFTVLFDALRDNSAELRLWLMGIDLAGFNANGRAPDSKYRTEMIAENKSDSEWIAMELIEEGVLGVTKSVISSSHLGDAIAIRVGERPRSTAMNHLLRKLGFRPYSIDNSTIVKWDGKACRMWTSNLFQKGEDDNKSMRDALSVTR